MAKVTAPGAGRSPRFFWSGDEVVAAGLTAVAAALTLFAPLDVAAAGALGFVILAVWFPLPGLCLVVVTLPFYLVTRPIGRFDFSPTEILILLNLVAGVGAWAKARLLLLGRLPGIDSRKRPIRKPSPPGDFLRSHELGDPFVLIVIGVFLVAAVASLTASATVHESLQSLRVIVVEPVLFYVLALTRIHSRRGAVTLALALVVAGVAISSVGLWQYVTNERIITAEAGLRRIRGFYGSPNNLGLFLGRTIPLSLALALWWRHGRAVLVAATLVMVVALFLTFSLGAWVAVSLGVLVVAALHGWRSLRLAAAVGIVGVGAVVVTALSIPRIGSHLDLSSSTTSIRLDVWQSGMRLLADHRLRGIGLDNFLYYYQHGYRLPTAWQDPNLSHPHNLILDFWLSLGLPGPIILGCLLVRLAEIVVVRWQASGPVERGLYAGVVGALADTVFHGLVDNSFFLVDLAVLFWLMFAIVGVLQRLDGKQKL